MSTPANLVFIRHAAIDCSSNERSLLCGSHDAPLSALGRAQVDSLAARLQQETASALYASPLRRALDTARAGPPHLVSTMRLLKSLAEIHCGSVEGIPIDEIRRLYPDVWRRNEAQDDDDFCFPGGETYRRFRRRVLRAVRAIADRHPGGRVLIFTHAGVVNQVLGTIAGQSSSRWENFRPGNTAVTEVMWQDASGIVLKFDDRSHLFDASGVRENRLAG